MKFSLLDIINPGSTGTTDNFVITFYDSGYAIMTYLSTISATIVSGTLNSVSVTPNTYRIRDNAQYTFNFIPQHDLVAQGGVQIVVPVELSVTSSSL